MNIRLYHMAYPTLTLSSKAIRMKYSRSSFYDSSSSTLAISSSTPRTWLNNTSTSSMSLRSSAITISISSWRSESSKLPPCTFWVMSLKTWHPDGPEEGGSDPKLVSTSYHQRTTTLTRICQFLPTVYPALQPAQFTSHMLTQELAQVSVLELTCLWSLPSTPRRLPDRSDPGSSQPRSPVHRWGGRLFHRGRSGPSQRQGDPTLLHPCAFYLKKLSLADQNYDIRNRELLAIKLALEKWRHRLEGCNHHFKIISNYRNLKYLRDAKRLNPRQARWALFFTRFDFTVSKIERDRVLVTLLVPCHSGGLCTSLLSIMIKHLIANNYACILVFHHFTIVLPIGRDGK